MNLLLDMPLSGLESISVQRAPVRFTDGLSRNQPRHASATAIDITHESNPSTLRQHLQQYDSSAL